MSYSARTDEMKMYRVWVAGLILATVISLYPTLAGAETLTFSGKVVLTDKESGAIAIAPFESGLSTNSFTVSRNVSVTIGNQVRSFSDINPGDLVTVTYRREGSGLNVVEGISVTSRVSEERAYIILELGGSSYATNEQERESRAAPVVSRIFRF